MFEPVQYDLIMWQGSTFSRSFRLRYPDTDPAEYYDLTGWTGRLQGRYVRSNITATIDWTTENGHIIIDGAAGRITLIEAAALTGARAFGALAYDLELIDPSALVWKFLYGQISLKKEATR